MGEGLKQISEQLQLMGEGSLGEGLKQISEQLQLMGEVSLVGGSQTNIRTVTTHGGGESWGR